MPPPTPHTPEGMSIPESPVPSSLSVSPLGDVKNEQGTIEYWEVDWENDPQNARNWTFAQKWTAVSIVRFRVLALYILAELTSRILFLLRYPCTPLSPRCPAP